MPSIESSLGASNGPTILLNDSPIRQSHEFEELPNEEAGLMTDDEAFYYDRNYSRSSHILAPIRSIWSSFKRYTGFSGSRSKNPTDASPQSPRRGLRRFGFTVLFVLAFLGIMQLIEISNSAFIALFPGIRAKYVDNWMQIGKGGSDMQHWPTDITRDVIPISCHSHNDYWRAVPLYSGISAGCISTEADVWLKDGQLFVGHDESSLTDKRTLQSLYLDPLLSIIERQNPSTPFVPDGASGMNGVFDTDPGQVLTLLIDLKTDDSETFEAIVAALEPLRNKGYLTHFDGVRVVDRPLRIVGTGNAKFSTILSDRNPHKDIFMDAPITDMFALPEQDGSVQSELLRASSNTNTTGAKYAVSNSYYASDSFADAVGTMWGWSLSAVQIAKLRGQIFGAHARGLKVRYWELPAWPVSRRNALWKILVEEGVDVLNIDDLKGAVEEDWSRINGW